MGCRELCRKCDAMFGARSIATQALAVIAAETGLLNTPTKSHG
jgi:hypothetical protein